MSVPRCQSIWGHHFEPRYSTSPVEPQKLGAMEGQGIHLIIRELAAKTYHGDVCTRCGCIVNEQNKDRQK